MELDEAEPPTPGETQQRSLRRDVGNPLVVAQTIVAMIVAAYVETGSTVVTMLAGTAAVTVMILCIRKG